MKWTIVLGVMLLVGTGPVQAQEAPAPEARNGLYIDGFAEYTPFTTDYYRFGASYERKIGNGFRLSAGLSVDRELECVSLLSPDWTIEDCTATRSIVPLQVLWMTGTDHHLVVGGGVSLGYSTGSVLGGKGNEGFLWTIPLRLGYRYEPADGGLGFRIGYTPSFFGNQWINEWYAFSVGVGYSF